MKRFAFVAALGAALSGCSAGYYYDRASGLRVDANPKMLSRFQIAKTECNGEVAQARLAGSGFRPVLQEAALTDQAMFGCMSKRGYEVRAK